MIEDGILDHIERSTHMIVLLGDDKRESSGKSMKFALFLDKLLKMRQLECFSRLSLIS